jgi:hypothetical protein
MKGFVINYNKPNITVVSDKEIYSAAIGSPLFIAGKSHYTQSQYNT